MRKILAATDASRHGQHAVAVARALAQRVHGEFACISVDRASASGPPPDASAEPAERDGTCAVLHGLPGVEIVRYAETWNADLVVLGRHKRTSERPCPVGSVSDAVIRRRVGPSLFVPPEVSAFQRGMIALDGGPRGIAILAPAAAFLDLARARASVLCVLPDPPPSVGDITTWMDSRSQQVRAQAARLQLQSGPCELQMRHGNPVAEIHKALIECGADLLVLGVRRGGLRGDMGTGYVGRELLKTVPCAVLTVPI